MKKADAWIILRLDEGAIPVKDYIAVKGVYDSEDAALSAIPDVPGKSRYLVLRSRHFSVKNREHKSVDSLASHHSSKVQGLTIHPAKESLNSYSVDRAFSPSSQDFDNQLHFLQNLWNQLSPCRRRRAILPLLSQLTELQIARLMEASIVENLSVENSNLTAILKTPSGDRVDVRTVILTPERKKSPNLQFRSDMEFEFLALIIFSPALVIETARMIPVEALRYHARPGSHRSGHSMLNLRVTPSLLTFPGSKEISMTNYTRNVG
jgi:hypothetical protein